MDLRFNVNHGKWFATDVLRAIGRYGLIEAGDRVCVGLSGGKDSVTLLFILWYLQRYSHLTFDLSAVHVRTDGGYDTGVLRDYCGTLGVPYLECALRPEAPPATGAMCSVCARLKRGAAAQALAERGIGKMAYGHHADDAAETLLMNIVENRKLGSFSPKVQVESSRLILIRPMIYLDERTIAAVHRYVGLPLLEFTCPYAQHNVRRRYKAVMHQLAESLHDTSLARRFVGAMENVDERNLWRRVRRAADDCRVNLQRGDRT